MEDWIQVIIMIAVWILTAQQSKRNKRRKRMAALRKATVSPTIVPDSGAIEGQPEAVPPTASRASYWRPASAAPPTPVFQTVPDGVLREVYAQQSGTPPSLVDVSLSEYAQEATGAHATLVSPQPTLAQSGIQQSFNAYKQPTSVRERRRDSTRSVGIASSAPQQSEQYRDTEDMNFDLRQAIIYSEILTPKYKDYF